MKTIEMIDLLMTHADPSVRAVATKVKVRYVAEWSRMRGFLEGYADAIDDEGAGERMYAAVNAYVPPVEATDENQR